MVKIVHASQVRPPDVRVDLCRRDRRVAEQLLDHPQVCTPLQHVRRIRMAQHMRRGHGDTCLFTILYYAPAYV